MVAKIATPSHSLLHANSLTLGANATDSLKVNITSETSVNPVTVQEKPKLKLANPMEKNSFELINPFGDFSGFEQNVEKMQPIALDVKT